MRAQWLATAATLAVALPLQGGRKIRAWTRSSFTWRTREAAERTEQSIRHVWMVRGTASRIPKCCRAFRR